MGDSVLRIEAYVSGYQGSGAGSVFIAPKHSRAQRFHAFFEAIETADMESAHHALTALLNFDPKLMHDADFAKIARAVHDQHVYAAQHFAHEYQAKLAHQLEVQIHRPASLDQVEPMRQGTTQIGRDGLPHIDTLA
jgi:hypothetical protein